MTYKFLLIPGTVVGASSMAPTAEALIRAGHEVQLPDVIAAHGALPRWRNWLDVLLPLVTIEPDTILVGHSAATTIICQITSRTRCGGLLLIDGDIPPNSGSVPPMPPRIKTHVQSLAAENGTIPNWSYWWLDEPARSVVGMDKILQNPNLLEILRADEPQIPKDWLDDHINLNPWTHVSAAYLQTSVSQDREAKKAKKYGWPVTVIDGTHLHPTLEPEETAIAIITLAKKLRVIERDDL